MAQKNPHLGSDVAETLALITPAIRHSFHVEPDFDEGGYVIIFDDCPGCTTQCDGAEEIGVAALAAYSLWTQSQKKGSGSGTATL